MSVCIIHSNKFCQMYSKNEVYNYNTMLFNSNTTSYVNEKTYFALSVSRSVNVSRL